MAKGKAAAENPADAQPEVPVRDQIREAFANGKSRGEIAKDFGLKYQQVYAYTKDMGEGEGSGGRARVMVEWPKDSGNQRPRVEVIRELAQGIGTENGEPMKVGDIARALGTSYQIVYQATRNLREDNSPDDGVEEDGDEGTEEVASEEGDESFEAEDEDEDE
jgi:transposase-like protein